MRKHIGLRDQGHEIAVTPGEDLQNWLARYGICEAVQARSFEEPEPPPGVCTSLNYGVVLTTLSIIAGICALLLFYIAPLI